MENKSIDEQIKMNIVDELVWNSSVNAANVKVRADNRKVTLSGVVPSYLEKLIAAEIAKSVPGVYWVNNQINVSYLSTVALPSDEKIKSSAQYKLFWDPLVDSSNVAIEVVDGVITLSGKVDTFWRKLRVGKQGAEIRGVTDVINKLVIVPTKERLDEDIAQTIISTLERRRHIVDTRDVHITVKNGTVTIAGTVPNYLAWEEVNKIACFTEGIKDVKDELHIIW